MRQDDSKFFTAYATQDIRAPDALLARHDRFGENTVTCGMAVRVINYFEVVEVQHDAAKWMRMPGRERQGTLCFISKTSARQRTRQSIDPGQRTRLHETHDDGGQISQKIDVLRFEVPRLRVDGA